MTDTAYAVAKYLRAVEDIDVSNLLSAIDDCGKTLDRMIKLPIDLPRFGALDNGSYDALKKKSEELKRAFIEVAKEMGIREVVVPKMNHCNLVLSTVPIDSLDVQVYEYDVRDGIAWVGMIIGIKIANAFFPIARVNSSIPYVDEYETIITTALFIGKNPWVVDTLKKAMERVFENVKKTYASIMQFMTALKLLGTEVRE